MFVRGEFANIGSISDVESVGLHGSVLLPAPASPLPT